jgi:hypothetical protein
VVSAPFEGKPHREVEMLIRRWAPRVAWAGTLAALFLTSDAQSPSQRNTLKGPALYPGSLQPEEVMANVLASLRSGKAGDTSPEMAPSSGGKSS